MEHLLNGLGPTAVITSARATQTAATIAISIVLPLGTALRRGDSRLDLGEEFSLRSFAPEIFICVPFLRQTVALTQPVESRLPRIQTETACFYGDITVFREREVLEFKAGLISEVHLAQEGGKAGIGAERIIARFHFGLVDEHGMFADSGLQPLEGMVVVTRVHIKHGEKSRGDPLIVSEGL